MTKRDYYEILGVERNATEQELKSAYRQMALKFHPDRNPNNRDAEEKFKEAAEAYGILSDPQKRAAYDRYGHAGVPSAAAQGFDPSIFADFSDILGDFFGFGDLFGGGGGRRRTRAQRGEDLRFDLELSFEEAVRGKTAEIQFPRQEVCSRCQGRGGEPDGGVITCNACHGRGEVLYQQSFLSIRRTCPQCGGSGQMVRKPCTQCRGNGFVRVEDKIKVNIPAGVFDGARLRVSGKGMPGANGGPPGDLYVVIRAAEHPIFERQDNDLHCTIPINIAQAALGAEIQVPTIDGTEPLKIPEGTQSGATFRLKGRGVPAIDGHGRGDLFVHVQVQVPSKLTREQRKLFEQLREVLPAENAPEERKGIFEKVKDYFM